MERDTDPKAAFEAISEVAVEALKADNVPRGVQNALDLVVALAKYQFDLRPPGWRSTIAKPSPKQ